MQRPDIWSVSAINRAARGLLEDGIGTVWLEAEISNLARPASGHLYFSLKDAGAQLRAAFFRQRQRGSVRELTNGDQVLVRGKLSLYEPRGDYQLIVEHLEPAGEGALRRAYEILRLKLAAEGLFDDDRKQALPTLPGSIGIITSTSTAALRDVLKVLRRRMPGIPVIIYAATVQGDTAAKTLRAALAKAVHRGECDVLLMVRGGGSLEDLAAFNDEQLARDIAACPVPLISGVGHETDVTIVDFVSDQRAPTPSAAAEIAVPDQQVLVASVTALAQRLRRAEERQRQTLAQAVDRLSARLTLQSPAQQLARQSQSLMSLTARLSRALNTNVMVGQQRLTALALRLNGQSPAKSLDEHNLRLSLLGKRLQRGQTQLIAQRAQQLSAAARHLHAVSPMAVLGRGYAIVTHAETGNTAASVEAINAKDRVDVRLSDGTFSATVGKVRKSDSAPD